MAVLSGGRTIGAGAGRPAGEATAAFVVCVYSGVIMVAITVGLVADAVSLFVGVAVVAIVGAWTRTTAFCPFWTMARPPIG
jgi:hypothetical protein